MLEVNEVEVCGWAEEPVAGLEVEVAVIRRKAESGVEVRILMADADSPQCITRGMEERLFDAIPAPGPDGTVVLRAPGRGPGR